MDHSYNFSNTSLHVNIWNIVEYFMSFDKETLKCYINQEKKCYHINKDSIDILKRDNEFMLHVTFQIYLVQKLFFYRIEKISIRSLGLAEYLTWRLL